MTRLLFRVYCNVAFAALLPVLMAMDALAGRLPRAAIMLAARLRLKRWTPWHGLLPREAMVACGEVADGCYWMAFPASLARIVPWASGFRAVPADYHLARTGTNTPEDRLVNRAVRHARAACPGCVIFLATRKD